jgi:MFS family permease
MPDSVHASAARQIVFINAAHWFTHYCLLILPTAVLGLVAQEPELFGDAFGPILALATGMFVLYGVLSLPMGWLAARVGRKALMVAFWLGAGASMAATGLVQGPVGLAAALAATGAFAAIYHPIGTAMLVDAAGERVGRAVGINGVFGNFGVASAPVITAFATALLGWRWAFLLPGIACVAWGLLYLREPDIDFSKRPGARPFPEIPRQVVRRAVVVLLVIAAVSGLVFNAFTLLIPKLMEERLANDPSMLKLVGLLAFLATICGAATQFTVGRMIDRMRIRQVFMPLALIPGPAFFALSFLDGWVVVPLAGLLAAAIFGQVTVNETMTARYIAPALRARMYSVRFFVGFLGSAAAAPLVGWLHAATGNLAAVIIVLGGFALITLACAFAFPDRREELRPELWAVAPRPSPAE